MRIKLMTNKERKQLKHSLKTEIDRAETWILLALTGEALEANEHSQTAQTCEVIISHLEKIKASITEKTEKYIETIDEAINKLS